MSVLYQVAESVYIINKVRVPDRIAASNDKDGRLRVGSGDILFIIICFSLEIAKLQKNRKPRKHNETIFAAAAYKCEKKAHILLFFYYTAHVFEAKHPLCQNFFVYLHRLRQNNFKNIRLWEKEKRAASA